MVRFLKLESGKSFLTADFICKKQVNRTEYPVIYGAQNEAYKMS